MSEEKEPGTYGEALFEAKRGFLIIGLTGYTGSGCTTASIALTGAEKLSLPIIKPDNQTSVGNYSARRFEKLKAIWNGIDWKPFIPIEVGVVIFALLAKQALNNPKRVRFLNEIKDLCEPHKTSALKGLNVLDVVTSNTRRLHKNEARDLVKAYELCVILFGEYKARKKKDGKLGELIKNLQNAGDKIRMFGEHSSGRPHSKNMFVMPDAIRKIISAYRKSGNHNRFVIDAFRNPFEVEYFRRRYEEFYLIGVFRNDSERKSDLAKHLNEQQIEDLRTKEDGDCPTDGKSTKQKPKDNRKNIGWWVTGQNIPECLQKADIFINNQLDDKEWIYFSLTKTLALINKPGCLTPSNDEHNMQIASTARLMSGCLSRQVGASIIGAKGYVLGIGWNDPPQGQVPCALRSCEELIGENALTSNSECIADNPFSEFERADKFRSFIKQRKKGDVPFCFRTELAGLEEKKSVEYTRSLHAEENAFLQTAKVGGMSLFGATLYTTASTCTLCAKKAYQLGVKRIVFIERYPDKAHDQTIQTGTHKIFFDQFEGITGSAYYKLYAPLMPEKDLIDYYS